jgi:hypothetical protein
VSVRVVLPIPVEFAPEPMPAPLPGARPLAPVAVAGARLVLVNNRWRSMNILSALLRERLLAAGAREVADQNALITERLSYRLLNDLGGLFDAARVGLGI